ncbi:GNAT family N-acetyltransferase [Kitasatospora sp. NPDC089509]|uniref:GNAT family N-acetyltransferase n=1 Tax=Kitasatospora sp. NPDC089509 TaxID=3364079 RepID=UPI0037F5609D
MTTGSTTTAQAPAADRAPALDRAPARQARNSAAFWAATGRSRGHQVIRRRGFLAVDGDGRTGLRILLQEPDPDAGDLAELADLVRRAAGPVTAEDPFSTTDLAHLGLRGWQMPVMLRPPTPAGAATAAGAPAVEVVRVREAGELRAAERVVIEGFELSALEPHRPGELFPPALLGEPGVDVFLARAEGTAVGALVRVVHEGAGSHYWVAASPRARSRGVGRAVMLASLADRPDLPFTLTASKLGRPLYESLGYTAAAPATWWASR